MDIIRIHMWHFADIEPESLENHLRVANESTCAKLVAWIMSLFQDQDSAGKMREIPCKVKRGGKPGRSTTDDENVTIHKRSGVGSRPGFKEAPAAFIILVEREIGQRFIRNEALLGGILDSQIEIRMPRA